MDLLPNELIKIIGERIERHRDLVNLLQTCMYIRYTVEDPKK
jgi:hypothetical protein